MIDLLCLLEFYNTYETDEIYHKIAEKMLENFSAVSEMSISELSEFLFVSQSTIYHFIKMMGYENYNQMKLDKSHSWKIIIYREDILQRIQRFINKSKADT